MADATLVDSFIKFLKNNKIIASLMVFGAIVIGIGSFTDSLSKIEVFYKNLKTSNDPKYIELIENVSNYVIDAEIKRVEYSGDIVITPIVLFKDSRNRSDGTPSDFTYLLCRFTNTGSRVLTVGALMEKDEGYYRLDDPMFGYRPVLTTLAQWQGWYRGMPLELLNQNGGSMEYASLEGGATKYGYINSLGKAWPERISFQVFDVTDEIFGEVTLEIRIK